MLLTPFPRPLAALAAAAAVAVPVAGCGSSSSSAGADPGADPAAALPAAAPVYVEAQIRPDGELKTNVESVGRKLLQGKDPGQMLVRLLDKELHQEGGSYQKDIEPWLGDRAGLAVVSMGAGGSEGDVVAAIASKDDEQARAFIDRQKDTTQREYRGVQYRFDRKDKDAVTVLDGRVLAGTEPGLKAAIDAVKGDSLAEQKQFQEARDAVSTDGLGFVYVDPRRTIEGVSLGQGDPSRQQGAQAVKGLLAAVGLRAVAASVDVEHDAITGDMALLGMTSKDGAGDSAAAAAAVPADAWLSAGVADVGGAVQRALKQWGDLGASAGAGMDPQVLLQQLKTGLGVDVQRDFLSWMGDAAVFVEGTDAASLRGALVIQSKDPAKSQHAIQALKDLLPRFGSAALPATGLPSGATGLRLQASGVPGGVQIAAKGDRFVIGIGRGVLADALAPSATLGSTSAYGTAKSLLAGAKPSVFLDTPKAVALAQAMAGSDAGFQKAKPTLDAFGPMAAGGTAEDGVPHVKLGIAVR